LTFPENAKFDREAHMLRWFNHHLKGTGKGAMGDPTVQYYVMGAVGEAGAPGNERGTAKDWPIKAESPTHCLRAGGSMSRTKPNEEAASTTFAADPVTPATIPGRAFPGAKDARDFEKQAEVRTFTTDVLTEPVEWTGKVRAELWVSS